MALTTATDAEVDIASIWQQYKAVPDPLSEQERRQMRNFLVERFLPLVKYNGERIWSRLPEGVELDVDAFVRGIADVLSGQALALSQEEIMKAIETKGEQEAEKM